MSKLSIHVATFNQTRPSMHTSVRLRSSLPSYEEHGMLGMLECWNAGMLECWVQNGYYTNYTHEPSPDPEASRNGSESAVEYIHRRQVPGPRPERRLQQMYDISLISYRNNQLLSLTIPSKIIAKRLSCAKLCRHQRTVSRHIRICWVLKWTLHQLYSRPESAVVYIHRRQIALSDQLQYLL